jgi:hypothetical protein
MAATNQTDLEIPSFRLGISLLTVTLIERPSSLGVVCGIVKTP